MKQKALESFLNDSVTKLKSGLYEWRGRYYQVMYYKFTIKTHQSSHFIKFEYANKVWGIREVSSKLLKLLIA